MIKRNPYIDVAKGIAILLVIVGHCSVIPHEIVKVIYSFHMPLFFIFAGFFYHQKEPMQSLKQDFRRLIVPYLVFAVLYAIKFSITDILKDNCLLIGYRWLVAIWGCGGTHSKAMVFGEITDIGIIWFLPAMFWCKNIFNIISFNVKNIIVKYFAIVLISIFSTILSTKIINFPFGILTGSSAMMFYFIGTLLKQYEGMVLRKSIVLLMAVGWILQLHYGGFSMDACIYSFYPLDVLGACGGTVLIYLFSRFLCKYQTKTVRILEWIGQMSMVVFCMHYVTQIIDPNTRIETHDWKIWLIIDFAFIFPLVYLCTKISFTKKIFQIK